MPIQLKSKKRIESAALPGVAFTVRRLSQIRLASRDLDTLEAQARLAGLVDEWREIMEPDKADLSSNELLAAWMAKRAGELTREQSGRIRIINRERDLILDESLKPASIRTALISVEGLTDDDGLPVDIADKLLAQSTPDLNDFISEVYAACEAASGLDAEETKNLPSPITGSEPATGDGTPTA